MVDCPRCGEPAWCLYPVRVAHDKVIEVCSDCEDEILGEDRE